VLQAELPRDLGLPRGFAIRLAAADGIAQGSQLCLGFSPIHDG